MDRVADLAEQAKQLKAEQKALAKRLRLETQMHARAVKKMRTLPTECIITCASVARTRERAV